MTASSRVAASAARRPGEIQKGHRSFPRVSHHKGFVQSFMEEGRTPVFIRVRLILPLVSVRPPPGICRGASGTELLLFCVNRRLGFVFLPILCLRSTAKIAVSPPPIPQGPDPQLDDPDAGQIVSSDFQTFFCTLLARRVARQLPKELNITLLMACCAMRIGHRPAVARCVSIRHSASFEMSLCICQDGILPKHTF